MKKVMSLATLAFLVLTGCQESNKKPEIPVEHKLRIVTSTFPIYLFTKNIVQGIENVSVDLLIPASLGCPHNYALTPGDMQKLSSANILVINGLAMEEFLGAPLKNANTTLTVVNSGEGIENLLEYKGDHEEHEHSGEKSTAVDDHDIGEEHESEHSHHEGINPHLFASPVRAKLIIDNIAMKLSRIDTVNREKYLENRLKTFFGISYRIFLMTKLKRSK